MVKLIFMFVLHTGWGGFDPCFNGNPVGVVRDSPQCLLYAVDFIQPPANPWQERTMPGVCLYSHSRWQHIYNAPAVGAIGLVGLSGFPLIQRVDKFQFTLHLIEVLDYSLLLLQWSNKSLIHPLAFSGYMRVVCSLGSWNCPE